MKGRIKRADLDHLLRLVQTGLPERAAGRRDGGAAEDDASVPVMGTGAPNHAFWIANRSFWVDKLKSDTDGAWTQAQYAAAASIINAAEYQHVLFRDIASALTRGLSGDAPDDADLSEPMFARSVGGRDVAARSQFDETIDLVDASTGDTHNVRIASVVEDVRRSALVGERQADGAGAAPGARGGADKGVPDIGLSPKQVNLGELTGARTRDGCPVPFNDVRGELFAQSGLTTLLPYVDWDDFRHRNQLSDGLIADLKAAYPDGFGALDLWVGGLAERPAVGALGPTIAATLYAEIAQMHNTGVPHHLDLLAGTHLASEISAQSWSDIVARNMSALHLASFVEGGPEHMLRHGAHSTIFGTEGDDVLFGTDGRDVLHGTAGDDYLDGGRGADVLIGGSGNDTYVVDDVRDRVIEHADGGDGDTILTTLNAYSLDDATADAACVTEAASDSSADTGPIAAATACSAGDAASSAVAATDAAAATTQAAVEPDAVEEDPFAEFDESEFGYAVNVENLTYIGDGDFVGRGNSAANVLKGGSENDMLWGRGGDDVLIGNEGDDALFGGSGADVLFGGAGDDWLDGGSGNDVLYLASGAGTQGKDEASAAADGNDVIVLKPGFGNDVVIGFDAAESGSPGHDRLDVSAYSSLCADSIGTDIQIIASGPHTIITINGDSITLLDVNANAIGKDDFIFS